MDVNNVGSVLQNSSTNTLGTGTSTINDAGCVLTSYVRIANAVGGKDISLDKANEIAIEKGLYTNKDELSVENGVKLINELIKDSGKVVSYEGSITGTTTEIAKEINKLEASTEDYYLTARLNTENADGTKKYEHTVNINGNSVFANDITDMDNSLNIRLNDTSSANRQSVENDKRDNEIQRVDMFSVKEKKGK